MADKYDTLKEEYNVGKNNGYTTKTVITDDNDTIEVQVPRDRNSTFEPVIIPKHEKRTPLFNDQIISMYSFGMRYHEISFFCELFERFVKFRRKFKGQV